MIDADHCEKCGCELNGEAALIEALDEVWCHSCADNAAEAAWERYCENFHGGSDPLTIREKQIAAWRLK